MSQYLICLIGASGTGKDTIKKYLIESNPDYKVLMPITTRPMRHGEKDNVDYIFLNNDDFMQLIKDDILLEHRKYDVAGGDTWYYGFMNPSPNNRITIMVCPLEAYMNIKDNKLFNIIPFYIYLKPSIRLERMIQRENTNAKPNYKELARRFFADENDFSTTKLNEAGLSMNNNNCYHINNLDSQASAEFINTILRKEGKIYG